MMAQAEAVSSVARVSSAEELVAALADPSIEHVVITAHLSMAAAQDGSGNALTMPMSVAGPRKTIRVRVVTNIECAKAFDAHGAMLAAR